MQEIIIHNLDTDEEFVEKVHYSDLDDRLSKIPTLYGHNIIVTVVDLDEEKTVPYNDKPTCFICNQAPLINGHCALCRSSDFPPPMEY